MITRRTFTKSLALIAGTTVSIGVPTVNVKAMAPRYRYNKATRIVIVGNPHNNLAYVKLLQNNAPTYEIVGIVYEKKINDISFSQKLNLDSFPNFASFDDFIDSKSNADVILFIGSKDLTENTKKALKSMYDVWSDRPISVDPKVCVEIKNLGMENFSQANFAYFVDNDIRLMENKIYSAPV